MLFVQKGYCRCDGKKCRHLKVKDGKGLCRKKPWCEMRNKKTGKPKNISKDPKVNIKAPEWCPKLKH